MAETYNDWIASGDRTHQNLQLVDSLKVQLTYEGRHTDLERLEKAHLEGSEHEFGERLFYAQESQRIYEGDRSHPRLVEIDALALTYDGWEADFEYAVTKHKESEFDLLNAFKMQVESMKRKQEIFLGNHSHENIRFLESLHLSYPQWEKDVEKALEDHKNGYSIDYHKFLLPEKQRMFDGNRSHPRLVALDSLELTYDGWQDDAKEAERQHLCQYYYSAGIFSGYKSFLDLLLSKQAAGGVGFQHPVQRQILETSWTYPGFESDMEKVKAIDSIDQCTDHKLEIWVRKCNLKEAIHCGDFDEYPTLRKLYELELSYPSWEVDFEEAKNTLLEYGHFPVLFDQKIDGLKNKQALFEGTRKEAEAVASEERPSSKHSAFGTCAICFDEPRTHLFVPCGHACVCKSCSAKVMAGSKRCPICNKGSILTTQFFLP